MTFYAIHHRSHVLTEAQAISLMPILFFAPWAIFCTLAGYLADRQVAALGCDSNSDTAPSVVDGVAFPVHVLAINAMGLYLLDYLQFEDLVPLCEAAGRWSFLCVTAPLRLPGGTGSPVNPIAIL